MKPHLTPDEIDATLAAIDGILDNTLTIRRPVIRADGTVVATHERTVILPPPKKEKK